ncbi:OLC1v1024005C1 [Oldenlandia corymbosa var. corymbosa]|uniref:OLC1v1024005C1 n=1 Tax=Oldenlandia corymbosa var. corymbosa TaxID=529605 RepID=A0AAV1C2Q7_OLDCO|nr:OLC1v1024005C1 [Oldenlandia corymbosa var. corymbosa]
MDAFEGDFVGTEGGTEEQIMQPPPPPSQPHPFEDDGYVDNFDYDAAPPPPMAAADDFGFDGGAPPPEPLPMGDFSDPAFGISPENDAGINGEYGGQEKGYDIGADTDGIFSSDNANLDGPILPDPSQMREEGAAFREWRRQNAIHLEEKEKKEKEMRNQIIEEAEEYKRTFYEKLKLNRETAMVHNREREKLYHANQEKFHKEADKNYWKAIAEIIPREVPNFEKRRGKKEEERKPSIMVIQGPKPGKPTDLARMRQMLQKLKNTPPPHMIPPPPPKEGKDAKEGKDGKEGKDEKDKKDAKDAKEDKTGTPNSVSGDKTGTPESATAAKDEKVGAPLLLEKVGTPTSAKANEQIVDSPAKDTAIDATPEAPKLNATS